MRVRALSLLAVVALVFAACGGTAATTAPTAAPSAAPTAAPTAAPLTAAPSAAPTAAPSAAPTLGRPERGSVRCPERLGRRWPDLGSRHDPDALAG